MSNRTFNLPDLGEGLTEAEIVEWSVEDGATVGIDDVVVTVETAKATVEVPVPYAGTVATRHGKPGDVVAVGSPLITVSSDEGSGAVLIGYGTGHGGNGRRQRAGRQGAGVAGPQHDSASPPSVEPSRGTSDVSKPPVEPQAPRVISPIVRRLAQERGVDLRSITPASGTVIRRADVEAAATSAPAAAVQTSAPTAVHNAASAAAQPVLPASVDDVRIPLTGVRRAIAEKLSTSRREIPHATTWVDVDATGLIEARNQLRDSGIENVGVLALMARFCVAALKNYPELNASVEGNEIVRHGRINLGFAAQSPRGLVVPVIKDAGSLTTRELGAALADLTARARTGDLSPSDLAGGTFTLNNYGVFGVDGSTPILNHPEAAMLGVGRIIERPWVVDGALTVRRVTQLGLTFDHRVCDGGSAGGFLRFVADAVERPLRLLADS
ncbi:dihydrolipoamide acetyltransferase family protein [Calidifontibacter terrae]